MRSHKRAAEHVISAKVNSEIACGIRTYTSSLFRFIVPRPRSRLRRWHRQPRVRLHLYNRAPNASLGSGQAVILRYPALKCFRRFLRLFDAAYLFKAAECSRMKAAGSMVERTKLPRRPRMRIGGSITKSVMRMPCGGSISFVFRAGTYLRHSKWSASPCGPETATITSNKRLPRSSSRLPKPVNAIPICYARAQSSNCAIICTGLTGEIVRRGYEPPVLISRCPTRLRR
jgi:hypothetical protein